MTQTEPLGAPAVHFLTRQAQLARTAANDERMDLAALVNDLAPRAMAARATKIAQHEAKASLLEAILARLEEGWTDMQVRRHAHEILQSQCALLAQHSDVVDAATVRGCAYAVQVVDQAFPA